jgi:hypothetical protein
VGRSVKVLFGDHDALYLGRAQVDNATQQHVSVSSKTKSTWEKDRLAHP